MHHYEKQNTETGAASLDKYIKDNDLKNGESLKSIQRKLNDLGHDSWKVDGLIWPNTRRGLESFMRNYTQISQESQSKIQAELQKNKSRDTTNTSRSAEKIPSAVKVEWGKLIVSDTIKNSWDMGELPDLKWYYHDSENSIGVKVDEAWNITNLKKYGITWKYDRENQSATYIYRGKTYTQIEINYGPKLMPDGPWTRISERQWLRAVDYDSRTKTAATYVNDLIQVEESGVFKNNELYTGEVRNVKTRELLETYEKGKLTYSNNPGTIVATMSKQ